MLTFEDALVIAKAAARIRPDAKNPLFELLHPRDSRGRFAKKMDLVSALARLSSDKPALPLAQAPTRNVLARVGPRQLPASDASSTVRPMTTRSRTPLIDSQAGIAERERADREAFRAGGPIALTPAQIKRDDRITGYADRSEVKRRMMALGLSEGAAETQLVAVGVPSTDERMNTDAYRRLVGENVPRARTLADARRERDQVDATLMRLGGGLSGPRPEDARTVNEARMRAAELDAEIAGFGSAGSEPVPAAPRRLTGAQLLDRKADLLTPYGKREDVKRKLVAAGLSERDADDQLTELGVAPGAEMSYTAIQRAKDMAATEYETHMRGQTGVAFDRLLAEPGTAGAITHKPSRQVLEDLRANGWELIGTSSIMGNATFKSPNGSQVVLSLPFRDGNPSFSSQSGGKMTYKAARELAAQGSVMPEAPRVVEVDPYAPRQVAATDIVVGDEYQPYPGAEWRRVGAIYSRKDGLELHDGTMNWDSRISTISGSTEMNRPRTVRTPRPAGPAPVPHLVDERAETRTAMLADIDRRVRDSTQAGIERNELAIRRHADAVTMSAAEPDDLRWSAELAQARADLDAAGIAVGTGGYQMPARGGRVGYNTRGQMVVDDIDGLSQRVRERYENAQAAMLDQDEDNINSPAYRQASAELASAREQFEAAGLSVNPTPGRFGLTVAQMILNGERMYGTDRRKWPARAQADLAKLQRKERGAL